MRLGILPLLKRPEGGILQYSFTMLAALRALSGQESGHEVVVFASDTTELEPFLQDNPAWTVRSPEPPGLWRTLKPAFQRLARTPPGDALWSAIKARRIQPLDIAAMPSRPDLAQWYRRSNIDLMLYPVHTERAFEVGIPYVMALHDLAHRLQPEFHEITGGLLWEWAERTCRNSARYATLLLADSDVGREDILNAYARYGVEEDKVKVLPFVPPPYLRTSVPPEERQRIQHKYGLPAQYLFYPGDIAAHKNQAQIVRALGVVKDDHQISIPVVFSGFHTEQRRQAYQTDMMIFARRHGLPVHRLGYVPDAEMSALYAGATALVIPRFDGPTNLPIYEAWACGCPVLTSNIRGIREQVGDAGVLVEPRSVDELAHWIYRLWTDDDLRRELIERGRQRLAMYTFNDFCARFDGILGEARDRVRTSGGSRRL